MPTMIAQEYDREATAEKIDRLGKHLLRVAETLRVGYAATVTFENVAVIERNLLTLWEVMRGTVSAVPEWVPTPESVSAK